MEAMAQSGWTPRIFIYAMCLVLLVLVPLQQLYLFNHPTSSIIRLPFSAPPPSSSPKRKRVVGAQHTQKKFSRTTPSTAETEPPRTTTAVPVPSQPAPPQQQPRPSPTPSPTASSSGSKLSDKLKKISISSDRVVKRGSQKGTRRVLAGPDAHHHVVDDLGRQGLDLGMSFLDRPLGERRLDEHPLRTVPRIVLGDHVRLRRRPDRSVSLTGQEDGGAPLDVHEIGVARDAPQAVARVAVHRLVRPHPAPHVVWVAPVQLGIEQVGDDAAVAAVAGFVLLP